MKYLKALYYFSKTNIIQTIRFNMKMLPFKQAIRMPVWFYGKVIFRSLDGRVQLNSRVFPGMVKVGIKEWYVTTSIPQCTWTINGKLIFNGPIRFLQGSYVLVAHNAELELGTEGAFMGSDLKILCFDSIKIGNNTQITWGIQIMDTSFHYIDNNGVKKLTSPVTIGDSVWIGNRCTITKGAFIPNNTIVAQSSLVNKNYRDIKPYTLLAGCPAIPKTEGAKRIWDEQEQAEYDVCFGYDRTHL